LSEIISILVFCWVVIKILLGVGFIIFVHELGHFAVAKLCGVKCEKFYLGFDIGGWKLCKFRYGETEYGIGILPLGGYVKMLGQEDNPAKLKEEIERAKLQQADGTAQPAADGQSPMTNVDLAEAEKSLYDPRSYLAKSVSKRMAIISAGVIMNVIFAFVLAAIAYAIGVEQPKCTVGEVFPGEAAWRAGLQPGDRILEVAGQKVSRFTEFQKFIAVGDIDNGVSMLVDRPGMKEPLHFVLHPDKIDLAPSIGIMPARTTTLVKTEADEPSPAVPGSAASQAKPPLKGDDRIVSINGEKIDTIGQLRTYLGNNPEKPLNITMESTVPGEDGAPSKTQPTLVTVPPQPMRTLGLVMEMDAIAAVKEGSPAEKAGIQAGDRIVQIDGKPVVDPLRLPSLFATLGGKTIDLTIEKEGKTREVTVKLHETESFWPSNMLSESALVSNRNSLPISIPQLGIAYRVRNRIERVLPGSPAEKAGIKAGETIDQAVFLPLDIAENKGKIEQKELKIDFDGKNDEKLKNWPLFFLTMQLLRPETKVELTLDKDRKVTLQPMDSADWFNPDRGLFLDVDTFFQQANSLGEALRLGANETGDSLLMVVKILQKMKSRQVSPMALGGPGMIAFAAYHKAKQGMASFLLFLTMLSANLAVLNILPIPMLDGGHLVFLAYEGIRGKPADERVQIVLSIIGFVALIALMVFVIGLDISRFIFGK
jgi:regulator of sigma E protease